MEVDGAYFGGHVRPANHKENRRDRRLAENQTGKRRVVVVMRERKGITLPFVFRSESQACALVGQVVAPGSTIYADEAACWDMLHARFLTKRSNHREAYADGEACTNMAESFFSRLRRAEIGIHHHISGRYLAAYAREMAWCEDHRRRPNCEQYLMAAELALRHPVPRQRKGYWQRSRQSPDADSSLSRQSQTFTFLQVFLQYLFVFCWLGSLHGNVLGTWQTVCVVHFCGPGAFLGPTAMLVLALNAKEANAPSVIASLCIVDLLRIV